MSGDIEDAIGEVFDPSSAEPASGFDPIPAGWYPLQVESAEVKETKAKTGKILSLEFLVLDKAAGRKLFKRINIMNANQQAQDIGRRELSALTLGCGLVGLKDTTELIGKQVQGRVKIRQDEGRDPDNDVIAFKALDGTVPAPAPSKPAPVALSTSAPKPAVPGAAKKGSLPWK